MRTCLRGVLGCLAALSSRASTTKLGGRRRQTRPRAVRWAWSTGRKKERINNIINNKADLYVRQLFWLRGIVPKVLAIPAGQATKEAVQAITLEPGERAAVTAAIKEAAVKLHYPQSHPILTPSKARMSHLRDMLGALASGHGHTSNVEEMLGTSPFAARLAEASKRISPRFFSPVPPPSCTAVPPPAACAPAFP